MEGEGGEDGVPYESPGVSVYYVREEWEELDPEVQRDIAPLAGVVQGMRELLIGDRPVQWLGDPGPNGEAPPDDLKKHFPY